MPTKKVFKFPLPYGDLVEITMPRGARVLHVDAQHGRPCMWALVDPDAPPEKRLFRFAGTGHPIQPEHCEPPCEFVGTFFQAGGDLVWHIFEVKE